MIIDNKKIMQTFQELTDFVDWGNNWEHEVRLTVSTAGIFYLTS